MLILIIHTHSIYSLKINNFLLQFASLLFKKIKPLHSKEVNIWIKRWNPKWELMKVNLQGLDNLNNMLKFYVKHFLFSKNIVWKIPSLLFLTKRTCSAKIYRQVQGTPTLTYFIKNIRVSLVAKVSYIQKTLHLAKRRVFWIQEMSKIYTQLRIVFQNFKREHGYKERY